MAAAAGRALTLQVAISGGGTTLAVSVLIERTVILADASTVVKQSWEDVTALLTVAQQNAIKTLMGNLAAARSAADCIVVVA